MFFIYEKRDVRIFVLQNLFLVIFFSTLAMISFFTFSSAFFQNQFQLALGKQQTSVMKNSNHCSKNETSDALLEQFKEIVFKQLSSNPSDKIAESNSSIPLSIVVGTVTANGTQVSGCWNISVSNNMKVDGDTVFDTASITKTLRQLYCQTW